LQQAGSACFATISLRNRSDIRKGPAKIVLRWIAREYVFIAETSIYLDPIRIGRLDAKNVPLADLECSAINLVEVTSAHWAEFLPWKEGELIWRPIDGAEATEWHFNWKPELDAFAGVEIDRER